MNMRFMPGITYSLKISGVLLTTWLLMGTMAGAATEGTEVLTPEQAAQARDSIFNWLECMDCRDKELEMVARLGTTAVPSLIASLRQGPSEAQRGNMRRRLITLFARLKHSEGRNQDYRLTMSEAAYVEHHMNGYVNRYRIRAAIALGQIGGPEAKAALQGALGGNYPPSVDTVVMKSLKRMESSPAMPK